MTKTHTVKHRVGHHLGPPNGLSALWNDILFGIFETWNFAFFYPLVLNWDQNMCAHVCARVHACVCAQHQRQRGRRRCAAAQWPRIRFWPCVSSPPTAAATTEQRLEGRWEAIRHWTDDEGATTESVGGGVSVCARVFMRVCVCVGSHISTIKWASFTFSSN